MNRLVFRQIGLLSLVLLWLGSTNHCVFEALFSVQDVHAESTTDDDVNPTSSDGAPCHDSGADDHPCGVPCSNAGPVELKIAQQNPIENFSLALPNYLADINALLRWLEYPPKTVSLAFNANHKRPISSLRLSTLCVPNAPPAV